MSDCVIGLPEGLLSVLLGDSETGPALLEVGVDKISFTGSEETGHPPPRPVRADGAQISPVPESPVEEGLWQPAGECPTVPGAEERFLPDFLPSLISVRKSVPNQFRSTPRELGARMASM